MTLLTDARIPQNFITSHLESPAGSANLAVLGTLAAPVVFRYTAPYEQTSIITLALFELVADAFDDMAVFAGGSALTNGLLIQAFDRDGTLLYDPLNGDPVVKDADWTDLAGIGVNTTKNTGDDLLAVAWDLTRTGAAMKLTQGQTLRVTVQDDLSDLTQIHVTVQGQLFNVK